MAIVTLTTDFGRADWFVGTMKGVILGLAPRSSLVDLTHDIPAGDLQAASFALAAATPYFPKGTIHLVVVDPGVGGARRALIARTGRAWFVAPDNGVLTAALAPAHDVQAWALDPSRMGLKHLSATFHGRDLFAPAAARLSRGDPPARLGRKVATWTALDRARPRRHRGGVLGVVLYIDRFGNAITNLPNGLLPDAAAAARVHLPGRARPVPCGTHYGAVKPGHPVAVPGSSGYVEVAVHQGHAARRLRLKVGSPVRLIGPISPISPMPPIGPIGPIGPIAPP